MVLVCFLMGTAAALAQLPTATILGVVRDSSGALVPEAALTAQNATPRRWKGRFFLAALERKEAG